MDRELNVYLNLNTNEVVTGEYLILEDDYKRLTAEDLLKIIDNLDYWNDIDLVVYDELFNEYNVDITNWADEDGFYNIEEVIEEVKERVYGF